MADQLSIPASEDALDPLGWQPFETAPLDGTPVLVFFRGEMHVASHSPVWHKDNLRWVVTEPLTGPASAYNHRCAHDIGITLINGDPVIGGCEGPTHWMPLPLPPAEHLEPDAPDA